MLFGFDRMIKDLFFPGGCGGGGGRFAGVISGEEACQGDFRVCSGGWITEKAEAVVPGDAHDFNGGVESLFGCESCGLGEEVFCVEHLQDGQTACGEGWSVNGEVIDCEGQRSDEVSGVVGEICRGHESSIFGEGGGDLCGDGTFVEVINSIFCGEVLKEVGEVGVPEDFAGRDGAATGEIELLGSGVLSKDGAGVGGFGECFGPGESVLGNLDGGLDEFIEACGAEVIDEGLESGEDTGDTGSQPAGIIDPIFDGAIGSGFEDIGRHGLWSGGVGVDGDDSVAVLGGDDGTESIAPDTGLAGGFHSGDESGGNGGIDGISVWEDMEIDAGIGCAPDDRGGRAAITGERVGLSDYWCRCSCEGGDLSC